MIAWAKREDWRNALSEFLDRHTAKACAAAGTDRQEIADVLGDDAATVVWGAAFEDLIATDLPDGRNLADDYLRRRGWKEGASTREYIAGLRRSTISLYEVGGLVPGESMQLRDLVRGGDPVRVSEKLGSQGLRQWDRVATRVIPLREGAIISGTLMPFDHDTSEAVLASLRKAGTKAPREFAKVAQAFGIETDAKTLAGMMTPDLLLAGATFMVTNFWLDAALQAAQGRNRPDLVNSEGDPLDFTTLHFPLLAGVKSEQIRTALAAVPALQQENPGFWNWLDAPGVKPQTSARRGKAQTFFSTMEDGSLVLGTLALNGRRLFLEANSTARAERGRAMLKPALSGLVGPPLIERTDLEQMLAAERPPPEPSGLSPNDERALIRQTLEDHYRNIIDQPIPSLGGKTPRAAAKSPKGREKVVAWLKTLENHSAKRPAGDPIGEYDFGWMWRELGVEGLRH
ncbi:hypothetical protein [Paracraurococcus ruber]|uniref:Antitoxin Xre/MbcA/ParS-like toxin-binding domain-containing protein n=1 Tax=Paracraurococcus ruber TaxID=77675 RepID=A0ABS1D0X5_9PROT|nr:hypothetical protein [Paracraurococcus ruber]MBK1660260.1 hypothetical protein [Paracraurococcus ruber]